MLSTYNLVFLRKIIEPLVIIISGLIIGRILGKITKKVLFDLQLKSRFKLHRLMENAVKYSIYVLAVFLAIKHSGITDILINVGVIVALFLLLLLAFLLCLDLVRNSLAGVFVHKNIEEGNKIKLDGIEGKVEKISLIKTRIKSNGEIFLVPNCFIKKELS